VNDVVVYHPFNPQTRPAQQVPCWQQLQLLPPDWRVVDWVCADLFGYAEGLSRVWDGDHDLILVEHDNAPTPEQLLDMVTCPEPVCTRAYWMGPASSQQLDYFISVGFGSAQSPRGSVIPRATHSSVGCTRYSADWRKLVGQPDRTLWYNVENSLNKLVARYPGTWHCHWPMCEHSH
jgi:hypothetical protein